MSFASTRRAAIIGVLVAALAALFGAGGVAAAAAQPVAPADALTAPVTGTFTDAAGGTGTATETFTPSRFLVEGDQVLAEGVADLGLTDSAGQPVGTAAPTVRLPVAVAPGDVSTQASCEILDLVLGPLDLDLLGLVVHLDTVHLNITAESGPGNLLGNLLCAVANLLNGPAPDLRALTDLLNAIVALLNS
ncbi:MAG TPA: hypothetical protein VFV67_27300 [Actinophytocola sp.]|uniref:hypothetical protein n=1 Tax=Actinophytocola sp. TaxID=1872138 RepID=UPI002DB6761D|nr:hypothetical protein [Actinophytocola sp.]HEU5474371.1 hypothetical protein [Actinophytocola sp.]